VRDAHVAALNSGDADAWVAQFTEDGLQMPPNAPANIGMAMIGIWSNALLDHFQVEFSLAVDEIRVSCDWAFERGGYTIGMIAAAGGSAMQDSGKYITIYQKCPAGTWRMARDIWNSNNPAAP
jgi:ketosteroid isomerase-like protein